MKYVAVIFDMDGTILHSAHVWHQATKTLIESRGVEMTLDLQEYFMRHLHGVDIKNACTIIKEYLGLTDSLDDLIHEKRQLANTMYPIEVQFIDGFTKFHQELIKRGCSVGLATNGNTSTVAAANQKLNLSALFGEHLYTIDHVGGIGKPDPRIFQYTADKLGHAPDVCIVIEDSPHGVTAAKSAGMFCVGINTAKKPDTIKHADMIINHYDELDIDALLTKTR